MSYSSKLSVQRREPQEPQFITSWSEVQVTMWTCNWHLKWRQSCGTANLWHLMLFPGRWCQNYVKFVGPPVRVYWKVKSWVVVLENIPVWNLRFHFFFFCHAACHVDLSSPTRDRTCAPYIERVESEPPDGQWNSSIAIFCCHRLDGGDTSLAVKGQGCC